MFFTLTDPAIRDLEQMTQGSSDVIISWRYPQACYDCQTIIVEYKPDSGTTTSERLPCNDRNYTVRGLTPDSEHDIRVSPYSRI